MAACASTGMVVLGVERMIAGAYENATVVLRTVSEDVSVHGSVCSVGLVISE